MNHHQLEFILFNSGFPFVVFICQMRFELTHFYVTLSPGPTGLLLACGLGLLRTTYGDPDVVSDFTPVDTSIKAMIVAAWKRAVEPEVSEVPVYNCSTSIQRKFTTGFIVEMGRKLAPDVPIDKMIWLPGGSITKCKYNNYIRVNDRNARQIQ